MMVRAHGRGRPALALLCQDVRSHGGGGCTEQRSDKQLQRQERCTGCRSSVANGNIVALRQQMQQRGEQKQRRDVASSSIDAAWRAATTAVRPFFLFGDGGNTAGSETGGDGLYYHRRV